uniref:alpha-N-acetylgalactosaminide alpha-2,6-sialyltransferase n=1 Tax=Nothobranchius furzeri TaxID=105023 RepID=A0A8C6KW92_NOTFU
FMHKDNFNIKDWNRLSHFNNPFGFMDMKYDEPLLLPKPGGDGCVRCAVVGTGGILNGSKMGAEIDAHDYVFRMNAAVIKGFEEDVGNRTSVYVHTAHSITASLAFYQKYGYREAPHDEVLRLKQQQIFLYVSHIILKTHLSFFILVTGNKISYGFMTEDHSKYSNYYFQKFEKTHVIFFANHDYIMEKNLWKSFHDRKILKLYQRTETEG